MKKKGMLFVSSYYYPYISGLTVHAKILAESLQSRKYSVSVLTNKHLPELKSKEIFNGVSVFRSKPWIRMSRGFFSPDIFFQFLKLIKSKSVIVLHLPMPESFLLAPIARIAGKKVFLIYHANLNLPSWSAWGRLIEFVVLLNHIIAGLFSTKIIAYSKDYAEFAVFLRMFKKKVEVNYPPVEGGKMEGKKPTWGKESFKNKKIIGFAGRFAEEKGGDILIESLPLILKYQTRAMIVFAGETNLKYEDFYKRKKSLIDKYKDRVVFLGLVQPEKMPFFYSMCDVLALPSRNECFGLVQVEAMLSGCPVVAFDIPGGRVPISLTGMGKLAKPYLKTSFAKAIGDVLGNKKWKKPKTEIEKIFNLKKSINRYESIFFEN